MLSRKRSLVLLTGFVAAASLACREPAVPGPGAQPPDGGQPKEVAAQKARAIGLAVAPMPDWFKFQAKDTVNGWITSDDAKAITGHAWELWAALTTLTNQELNGQKVPVYETWWDADEALIPSGQQLRARPGVRT